MTNFLSRRFGLSVAILSALLVVCGSSVHAQTTPITRQETLRGTITPEREWWDVQHYDLAVQFMPTTRSYQRLERDHLQGDQSRAAGCRSIFSNR
jgi:hypothetical protein